MKITPTMCVAQAYRSQRAISEGLEAAAGDFLNGETGLEVVRLLKGMEGNHLGMGQGLMKAQVLLLREGTVEVVFGVAFPVATGEKDLAVIDALGVDDGGNGVVKIEMALAGEVPDRLC